MCSHEPGIEPDLLRLLDGGFRSSSRAAFLLERIEPGFFTRQLRA